MNARSLGALLGPFAGLVLVITIFGIAEPGTFLTLDNFRTVATQSVIPALGALGMALVIASGGIDLSVGSQVALCSVVCAWWLRDGRGPAGALAIAVSTGALCGLVNGLLITRLRVVPFIVTLGMLGIARGLAKCIAGEQTVNAPPHFLQGLMRKSPDPSWLVLAPGLWLLLVLALVMALVLHRTTLGVHALAIGSSEPTARLCGVRVDRVKVTLYALLGAFCGLAGVMSFARLTLGDPTGSPGLELEVIAAVVIGGASLAGGECSILGALLGALLMQLLRNGCTHASVPTYVQEIVIGAIIVVAVALDRVRARLARVS